MVRQSNSPHAVPLSRAAPRRSLQAAAAALAVVVLVALTPAALAQDQTNSDRLDRIERDLSMLQRQVYRGGPPPTGDSSAVSTEVRLDRIESQMRDLTGRVEEYANEVRQLRQRIEQINSDMDVRFNQPQNGQAAGDQALRSAPAPAASRLSTASGRPDLDADGDAAGGDNGSLAPPANLLSPGASVPAPNTAPAIFGTLSPPGTAPRRNLTAATAGAGPVPPPSGGSGGTPAAAYNHAFGLLKQADYPAAEQALRAFVQQHPRDALAGNAQYWLGETYYARGNYADAAATFAEGYKRYPKSAKAADELLKLGMSLARANQKQNACVVFGQLDHDFPHTGAAIKQRSSSERRRLGC